MDDNPINKNLGNIKKLLLSIMSFEEMKRLAEKEKNGCSDRTNPLDLKKKTYSF